MLHSIQKGRMFCKCLLYTVYKKIPFSIYRREFLLYERKCSLRCCWWNDIREASQFHRAVKFSHFFLTKFYGSSCMCVQGIIFSFFDIFSWVDSRTTLSNNDHSCLYRLTISNFGSKVLRVRITSKPGRATRLLMGHRIIIKFLIKIE